MEFVNKFPALSIWKQIREFISCLFLFLST